MLHAVEVRDVTELPIAAVSGRASSANLPPTIRALFDQFYANFEGKGGLNVVLYNHSGEAGEFLIECGVQVEQGGNTVTPGGTVVTTVQIGPTTN